MQMAVEGLLDGMLHSTDWRNWDDFKDTPKRVAKMYLEMLTPQENNWTTFEAEESDLIVLRGHRVIALCPHHLLPVEIKAFVGYIPNEKQLGLSKLARVVEQQLVMPIKQEKLAHQIANALDSVLKPKGVAVVLSGVHGCMKFRGVETEGDVVSSVMKGVLLLNPSARAEFFSLIGRP
jgi:GTP cyclohydrolase I